MASNFPVSEEAKKAKAEYDKKFGARPEQVKRRMGNNLAHHYMESKGLVRKGQDVHHKDRNPRNNDPSNLVAVSKKKNRGDNR